MTVTEAIQTIQEIIDNPDSNFSLRQLHALYFAQAVLRTLPQKLVSLIDDLLTLEVTWPRP